MLLHSNAKTFLLLRRLNLIRTLTFFKRLMKVKSKVILLIMAGLALEVLMILIKFLGKEQLPFLIFCNSMKDGQQHPDMKACISYYSDNLINLLLLNVK